MRRHAARPIAAALGLLADRLVDEPPVDAHPVARHGRLMAAVEQKLWRDSRGAGFAHAAIGVGAGAAAGASLGSTAVATWMATGGRMLGDVAASIANALHAHDLETARATLPALVGRDPSHLDEAEIARAVVESVAENTVDAVVAPALWAAACGAPGALGYRALNTLDSMVGHRSPRYEQYGWASARLDDAAGWIPARVTAALVAAVRPRAAGRVWQTVRRDAPAHPSPNAGVAEAAFAAALSIRLGGTNRYGDRVEERPPLGDGPPPDPHHIGAAVELSGDVGLALAGALIVAGGAGVLRKRG